MVRGGWSRIVSHVSLLGKPARRYSNFNGKLNNANANAAYSAIPSLPRQIIKACSAIYEKPVGKMPTSNGWNTRNFSAARLADVDELLAELEKEEQREKREKMEKKLQESGGQGQEVKAEEEEEEEDYMGIGEIVEKDVKNEGDDDDYDDDWDDDEEDEDERLSLKAQKKRKEEFDKLFRKHQDLLKNFRTAGTLDETYKWMERIDRFEKKHFALSDEYKLVGYLMNQLKEASGKERFILLKKTQRALKLLEWKEAYDPENPENYGIISQEDMGTGEELEQGGIDQEREQIEGQVAADKEDEDYDDEEKDEILRAKLRSIDKDIEQKLAERERTSGKQSRDLEEEIRGLVERRLALTETKKQPLYRKGFDAKLIDVNRTCKVTKGGQVIKYTALVVCGNYNGVVGFAKGKGPAVPIALKRAYAKSFQNLHYIERYEEHTIAHAIQTKYKKTKIYMWPAPVATGMTASSTVENVLYLAGLKNVKTKVIGSRHPHNTVKALFKALNMIETPKDIQQKFGRSVVESHLLK